MINDIFLLGPDKDQILRNLRYGFRADWAPVMPTQNSIPPNFFSCSIAIKKCRARFLAEVKQKRMLGGLGFSLNDVKKLLGQRVYVIPCGAVPKNNDPFGRIIHNYSYPSKKSDSVNASLINTSVSYITFKNRVAKLSQVDWFIKADLKNGYRQLPVHPIDWHTQIYSLGHDEFYIDIAMPFAKANLTGVLFLDDSVVRFLQSTLSESVLDPNMFSLLRGRFFRGPYPHRLPIE